MATTTFRFSGVPSSWLPLGHFTLTQCSLSAGLDFSGTRRVVAQACPTHPIEAVCGGVQVEAYLETLLWIALAVYSTFHSILKDPHSFDRRASSPGSCMLLRTEIDADSTDYLLPPLRRKIR